MEATTKAILDRLDKMDSSIAELKKPKSGNTAGVIGAANAAGRAPYVTSGALGESGYSILKAVGAATGLITKDKAKEEVEISNRIKEVYKNYGYGENFGNNFFVPSATEHMPMGDDKAEKLALECRQKMTVHRKDGFDPEEANWIINKMSPSNQAYWRKGLGTISDTAGGVLVGFPTLGELIDIQRNLEVFPKAGAQELTLPPNGRIQYPKLTQGATAYVVGEASTITESQQTTGNLDLVAKKYGVLVRLNNELLKFNSISAEGMVRLDMSRVTALRLDLDMLQGTGGTQIKGLIQYPTQSSWTYGNDSLILRTASNVGAGTTGDLFQPEDYALMEGSLPDVVEGPTAYIMRKNFYPVLMNRRADAAVPGDGKGQFMFWITRGESNVELPKKINNVPIILSSQVSNTRAKTGGTANLTYVLAGYFPDWIIARSGVIEFLANNLSDSAYTQDQTLIRGIQYIDAGPRHAASFCFVDNLQVA